MNAATTPFVISLCFMGAVALIPLTTAMGLIGILRKIIDLMEARWL